MKKRRLRRTTLKTSKRVRSRKKRVGSKSSGIKKLMKELDVLWSKAIHARDGVCQKCGGSGGLQAHHIYGRRNLATRWKAENGLLLDFPHHIHWAHRDPGGFMAWVEQAAYDKKLKISWQGLQYMKEAHNCVWKPTEEALLHMKGELEDVIKSSTGEIPKENQAKKNESEFLL